MRKVCFKNFFEVSNSLKNTFSSQILGVESSEMIPHLLVWDALKHVKKIGAKKIGLE